MTTTIKQHINSLPLDERADFIKDYNELQTELKQLNNMTKVSVFGQESTEQPKGLRKIEFSLLILADGKTVEPDFTPTDYEEVVLLCKCKIKGDYDLILAIDNIDLHSRALFLGHWNDGVI